jgi:hypothetical protein
MKKISLTLIVILFTPALARFHRVRGVDRLHATIFALNFIRFYFRRYKSVNHELPLVPHQ